VTRSRILLLAFAVLAMATLAFAAQAQFGLFGESAEPFFIKGVYTAIELGACALLVARVVLVPRERLAWAMIALALFLWFCGDTTWTFWLVNFEEPPFPNLADAFYYCSYATLYVGVVLLLRARLRPFRTSLWLDGAVVGLSAAAFAAALVLQPIMDATEGSLTTVAFTLAYPLGDLLILTFVGLAFALSGWRPGAGWLLLGAGMFCAALADSIYSYQEAAGIFDVTGVVLALWPVEFILIAAAAWVPAARGSLQDYGWRTLGLPMAFGAAAIGLLGYGALAGVGPATAVLAAAAAGVGILRAALTVRENAALLRASRIEATIDGLSGLPNRRALMTDLDEVATDGSVMRLVFFDLNGFKAYNDSFGHAAGDTLLRRLGEKLAEAIDGHGHAYRLGGDEFCALLHHTADEHVADAVHALNEQGPEFRISTSHGSVLIPADARDPEAALKLADERMYADKRRGRPSSSLQTRDVLMQVLTESEPDLHAHTSDVAQLSRAVGVELGLDGEDADVLVRAAELHDIGKVAIPDAILHKPGPLDEREWELMRQHTVVGERIVVAAPALRPVARIVRASHERWDGAGYPDRVSGADIPLGARIVAVCDASDAMTTGRPYRAAVDLDTAIAELQNCAGTQFDPAVVDAYVRVARREAALPVG
jgi:diguanylate cyclase (GGDEF)-like protein